MSSFLRWGFLVGFLLICQTQLITRTSGENITDLDDAQVEEVNDNEVEAQNQKPKVIDSGEININIQPVPEEEFSCEELPDGVQIHENPPDCQFFYICMGGAAHKIECPEIQGNIKTYFNPKKRACDNVDPDFCKSFGSGDGSGKEEKGESVETESNEDDDEFTSDRVEL